MLALAGHGSARRQLEALANNLGVASRVRFLGTLSAASLAEACQSADIFATASTSETQCMALLQAMSTGLPAVGARSRALVEYIPPDAGLLAEPATPPMSRQSLACCCATPPCATPWAGARTVSPNVSASPASRTGGRNLRPRHRNSAMSLPHAA